MNNLTKREREYRDIARHLVGAMNWILVYSHGKVGREWDESHAALSKALRRLKTADSEISGE